MYALICASFSKLIFRSYSYFQNVETVNIWLFIYCMHLIKESSVCKNTNILLHVLMCCALCIFYLQNAKSIVSYFKNWKQGILMYAAKLKTKAPVNLTFPSLRGELIRPRMPCCLTFAQGHQLHQHTFPHIILKLKILWGVLEVSTLLMVG